MIRPREDKAARRAERERILGSKQRALPTKQYGVLYADPPYRFEPRSRVTGMDRAADNHYPTMFLEQIKALQVPAAADSVLFLWATQPMLFHAKAVMEGWRFEYKSHCVWEKDRIGTGYWFRNQHEILLVGTRGSIPAPAPGTQFPSIIRAPVGRHSEKPAVFREMIEKLFPNLPRIELFARGDVPGWDVWGNEAAVMEQEAAE
jgi:N6-adenosine-specific RNA methylase IME4